MRTITDAADLATKCQQNSKNDCALGGSFRSTADEKAVREQATQQDPSNTRH
jgi:hypothetical protein